MSLQLLTLKDPGDEKLIDIVIVPDGTSHTSKGPFVVNEEVFKSILIKFKQTGIDMVFDYEHQTLGGRYARADGQSPAAGWIKSLRYEKGTGIIAQVEWTAAARAKIKSGEYRYLSPVLIQDVDTHEVLELDSVAVTNTPAIHGITRLAASRRNRMATKKTTRKRASKSKGDVLLGERVRLVLQEVSPEMEAATIEEVVEEVDDVGVAIAELRVAMSLGEDTSAADVVRAAVEKLSAGDEEGEEESAEKEEAMSTLRKSLGVKPDATLKVMTQRVDAMHVGTVSVKEYNTVVARLDAVEKVETDRAAETAVQAYVKSGVLNPNDEKKMEWARETASRDLEAFNTLLDGAPKLFEPGRVVTDGKASPVDERQTVIASACKEYDAQTDEWRFGLERWSRAASELSAHNMTKLTTAEMKAINEGSKV